MINSVKKISKRGNEYNEDCIGSGENYIFVIDGSSSLNNIHVIGKDNDAVWFSHGIGRLLGEYLSDPTISLTNAVKLSVAGLQDEFKATVSKVDINDYISPSASICIFRLCENHLEYFELGDCTSLIRLKSGKLVVLHNDTVSNLDADVIKEMVKISLSENKSVSDTIEQVRPLLIKNRKLKNTLDGYWILDIGGEGIKYAVTAEFNASEIENISLMSDGFADSVNTYKMFGDFDELNNTLATTDPEKIIDDMFALQENDRKFDTYPRLKFRDDTSVVWAKL